MAASPQLLSRFLDQLNRVPAFRWQGKVRQIVGQLVESDGPLCSVGECCEIRDSDGRSFPGEIIGFRGGTVLSMPLEPAAGLRYGDPIFTAGARAAIAVGPSLLGRVLNGIGEPMDQRGPTGASTRMPLEAPPPAPLDRIPIGEPIRCGVRAIDTMLTCGRGQRVGIFGGSGVGKSTLLGMMARNTSADLTVMALIGERGREVREFLEESLGEEGRKRAVVVVSTSDQSPLLRIRAALSATAISEYFCRQGKNVLLVVDSLTRLGMAQREISLAAGEPPTSKGYTPSVLTLLARLLERAGRFGNGSITAFYTVLMEGDDEQDPLVDTARSLLDGHIVLDRALAAQGHYPPIHILRSVSRLMPAVVSQPHLLQVREVRRLMAAYASSEDLIRIGAYQKGSDPELDRAIALRPQWNQILQQTPRESEPLHQAIARLMALPLQPTS